MKIAPRLLFIRLAALVALAACAVLTLDYLRATPAFCGINSGCEKVMFSQISEKSLVPVPVVGLAAFVFLYLVSLSRRFAKLLAPMAILAGGIGLVLILIQGLVIGAYCILCMIVDIAAVVIAGIQILSTILKARRRTELIPFYAGGSVEAPSSAPAAAIPNPSTVPGSIKSLPAFPGTPWAVPTSAAPDSGPAVSETSLEAAVAGERDESARWVWVLLAFAAMGIAVLAGFAKPRLRVPNEIRAMWVPDKINIVEITDFDCPHCRNFQPTLVKVLNEYGGQVHFIRIILPLRQHEQARGAASAYHCAKDQGKAEEMAERLFTQPLGPGVYRKFAEELGLDIAKFDECRMSRATDQRIDRESGWLARAGLRALPTTFIQDQVLSGTASAEAIRAAIRRTERNSQKPEK